jgi:pyruvate dehydrogenase kinase 2/3/4
MLEKRCLSTESFTFPSLRDDLSERLVSEGDKERYLQLHTDFVGALTRVNARHHRDLILMSQGILDMKSSGVQYDPTLQRFLDDFNRGRLSIRLLLGQHLALAKQKEMVHILRYGSSKTIPNTSTKVGLVDTSCNIYDIIQSAAANAQFVALQHYNNTQLPPEIIIKPPKVRSKAQVTSSRPEDIRFPYIPVLLNHMLFEVFKNSIRATIERSGEHGSLTPIEVHFSIGSEDLMIKVSDFGQGIPRSQLNKIWSYMYSTATPSSTTTQWEQVLKMSASQVSKSGVPSNAHTIAPLAGFGYGLPISR